MQLLVVSCLLASAIAFFAIRADQASASGVLITEVSTSNPGDVTDSDGEHPDWIEILNALDEPVDLTGWHLTNDQALPDRWSFPELVLQPQQRVVIFASGKDRRVPRQELHTNFRLDRRGAAIWLVEPDALTIADSLEVPEVPRGASYGRDETDRHRTCFFATPRPGHANAPGCHDDTTLGAPTFSQPSGFYENDLELHITAGSTDPGIIYTLDGSYPDLAANAANTFRYAGPIRLTDRTPEPERLALIAATKPQELFDARLPAPPPTITPPIQKATVVRARTDLGAETVATYFVGAHLRRDHLPVISLALDEDFLFDHDTGIYIPGRTFDDYVASDAYRRDAAWWETEANYSQGGRGWQRPALGDHHRPAVVEHCAPGGTCGEQVRVGVRIHGNYSREFPQKSLRLYADDDPTGPQFGAAFLEPGPYGHHRRLVLRNSGNDNSGLMFLDGYLHSLMAGLAAEVQAYRPAVVFLNGEHWGILNLRERYDQHYLAAIHGADPDTVVILDRHFEVMRGDLRWGEELQHLIAQIGRDEATSAGYRTMVEDAIDVDSFFDFVIAHTFTGNRDWPGNNTRTWKQPDGADSMGGGPLDGRWRWMIFDLDQSGGGTHVFDPDYDVFSNRMAPTDDLEAYDGYPAMFHNMMRNEELRHEFLRRFADHLNTAFRPERTIAEHVRLSELIAPEIAHHIDRWGRPASVEVWHELVERHRTFMAERPAAQRRQLEQLFELEPSVEIAIATDAELGHVRVNTVEIAAGTPGVSDPGSWIGTYWPTVPITLEAVPADGVTFERWEGVDPDVASGPIIEVRPVDGMHIRAVFTP